MFLLLVPPAPQPLSIALDVYMLTPGYACFVAYQDAPSLISFPLFLFLAYPAFQPFHTALAWCM